MPTAEGERSLVGQIFDHRLGCLVRTLDPDIGQQKDKTKELSILYREATILLDLIVAEWNSDPLSVQCFDLHIVHDAKRVMDQIKERDPNFQELFRR